MNLYFSLLISSLLFFSVEAYNCKFDLPSGTYDLTALHNPSKDYTMSDNEQVSLIFLKEFANFL